MVAAAPTADTSLPIGSKLTFVSDETVDARVRPGSEFRAHLKDDLHLQGTLVAAANTPARLVVTEKIARPDGSYKYTIALVRFSIAGLGYLPVKPVTNVVELISTGLEIPATTLGYVNDIDGRLRIVIPLPRNLSNDAPVGAYTPVPLRTAAPLFPRKPTKPTPTPTPTPTPVPSPTDASSATPLPAPSAS